MRAQAFGEPSETVHDVILGLFGEVWGAEGLWGVEGRGGRRRGGTVRACGRGDEAGGGGGGGRDGGRGRDVRSGHSPVERLSVCAGVMGRRAWCCGRRSEGPGKQRVRCRWQRGRRGRRACLVEGEWQARRRGITDGHCRWKGRGFRPNEVGGTPGG